MSASVPNVIARDGTLLIDILYSGDVVKFSNYLDTRLKDLGKICLFCTSEFRHKGTREVVTPAVCATKTSHPGFLRYMLSRGLNPSYTFIVGHGGKAPLTSSLLITAVESGNTDATDILLAANADVNFKDYNGETALHQAVRKLNVLQVRLILSYGADPSLPDRFGNSPLHSAAHSGHMQMVQILLKCNVDIYQKGKWGIIPLQIAAREGHAHIVELLCKGSAGTCNLNVCVPCSADRRARAPIHLAAIRGNYETLTVLLEDFNADPSVTDKDKNTALHFLVFHPYSARRMRPREDYVESARVLVSGGAKVNAKNRYGDTPLHLAVMNGYQMVLEILVESGADPNITNKHHLKPSDVVMEKDTVSRQILKKARETFKEREESAPRNEDVFYYVPSTGSQQSKRLNRSMDMDEEFMMEKHSVTGSQILDDRSVSSRPMSRLSDRRSRRSVGSSGGRRSQQRSKSVEHFRRQMSAGATLEDDLMEDVDDIYAVTSDFERLNQTVDGEYGLSMRQNNHQKRLILPRQPKNGNSSHIYAKVNVIPDKPTTSSQYRAQSVPSVRSQASSRSHGRYFDSSLSQRSTKYSPQEVHVGMYGDNFREEDPYFSPVDDIVEYNNAYAELEDPSTQIVPTPRSPHQTRERPKTSDHNDTNDSIKVSTVRGKPGTIEVEYGGKTLEIAVDNGSQDQAEATAQVVPSVADTSQSVPVKSKKRSKKRKQPESKTENVTDQTTKVVPQSTPGREEGPRQSVANTRHIQGHRNDPAVALANVLLESACMEVLEEGRSLGGNKTEFGRNRPIQQSRNLGYRQPVQSRSMENIAELSDSGSSQSDSSEPVTVILNQHAGITQKGPRIKIGLVNQEPLKKSTFV